MRIQQREVEVPESDVWKFALPAAAFLGIAAFMGPLVITAAFGALAVGATVATAGFAMTAMLFPFLMFAGLGVALTFGSFAVGTAMFVLPNLLAAFALLAVGGGLLLGWGGISTLMGLAAQTTAGQQQQQQQRQQRSASEDWLDAAEAAEREAKAEAARAAREADRELRAFDELLRRREREEQWRP
ncbi:hypothetical protein MNEG_9970 [Monoraphidium neglectum]|uniref:Uncharacterized protein n=1 Tax=Monoraphidium neglectum TaxID=145388 RepID=A0A0D2MU89_9CHLO|nr:hypothetical protein MNEG_9970 [Monoraphidium neglectum]KIY97995.1 hypothetical protein MNEG_9970 [Monoraphidium neglectum]|eukprot:XP_013897015.1 hypothetical protein MNEG_9970 [Monoraphidium neglectum]